MSNNKSPVDFQERGRRAHQEQLAAIKERQKPADMGDDAYELILQRAQSVWDRTSYTSLETEIDDLIDFIEKVVKTQMGDVSFGTLSTTPG